MAFFSKFSLLILLVFISGCSGNRNLESLFAPNSALTSDTNTENDNNQQNSSQSTNNNQGLNNKLPEQFPDNIPIYPQAEIITSNPEKLELVSSDPANLIISFYEQNLTENNWQIEQNNDNLLVANLPEKKERLELNIFPDGQETNFSLVFKNNESKNKANNSSNKNNQNNQNIPNQPNQNSNNNSKPLSQLMSLNIIDKSTEIEPYQTVTRREYARWLVKTNNLLFADTNSKQIRLANPNSQPIFSDVSKNDPDFPYIQGLAEAGLIPSNLIQDSGATTFRPDAPLTREDLIAWKVPLDYRQNLPFASLDTIKETWGFQDSAKIDSQVWQELYIDWQNGENANIRRTFGYITLFQPQKPVTYEEVAIVLNSFGYQGEIFSLNQVE